MYPKKNLKTKKEILFLLVYFLLALALTRHGKQLGLESKIGKQKILRYTIMSKYIFLSVVSHFQPPHPFFFFTVTMCLLFYRVVDTTSWQKVASVSFSQKKKEKISHNTTLIFQTRVSFSSSLSASIQQ